MALRVGLIGCGGIGALRADAVNHSPHARLVGVSDEVRSRVDSFSRTYGCDGEGDWRTLVRRTDLDAVIVSTPPSVHCEISIEALRNGKHVLCEKPLARTPEECRAMNQEADQHGLCLATGFNYRFYPSMLKARELLDSGLIGDLNHIRSYAGYSAKDHNPAWVHDVTMMGGGALRDNGIHLIDLTRFFLGEVVEVQGMASPSVWGFEGCEDNGFALLKNSKGVVASLQASWTEWRGYRFLIELYGTKGCIRAWCFPIMVHAVWSEELGGAMRKKTHFFPKTFLFEHLRSYRWVVTQSFIQEFEAFSKTVGRERTNLANGIDGMRAVEIAQALCAPSLGSALEGDG